MKWIRRAFVGVAALVAVLAGAIFLTALRTENPVGFQTVEAGGAGQRFMVGIWYPTAARPRPTTMLGLVFMDVAPDGPVAGHSLPLVVISHGNGGGSGSHADLAMALASAGYVVAAPTHPGDNHVDQRAVGAGTYVSGRVRQLRATLDHMLHEWPGRDRINPERIGAFGFSAGGLTVLTAAGAQPDLHGLARYCARAPEFACELLRHAKSPLLGDDKSKISTDFSADTRLKAAVVAAPAFGFLMPAERLVNVTPPIQLWAAKQDSHVPYATNIRHLREALGPRAEFTLVPGAGHFAFLTPCGIFGPPAVCSDEGGFDRKAFHADMNARVLGFFNKHLGVASAPVMVGQ